MAKKEGHKKKPYEVEWEDETQVVESSETEEPPKPEAKPEPEVLDDSVPDKPKHHHIHKHPNSIFFISSAMIILVLLWMAFVIPTLFWITIGLLVLALGVLSLTHRHRKAKEERQVMELKMAHPIKVGFEIALGMSMFFALSILVIGILVALIFGTVIIGFIKIVAEYLPQLL